MFHACSMCSYGARSPEALSSHVCKVHKSDPRFLVYCKSCLRSYTKWDSYRKHLQRGCEIMPTSTVDSTAGINSLLTNDIDVQDPSVVDDEEESRPMPASRQWHEAAYIISIKEKHVLAQVAVDQVLSATSSFVAEVLSGLMDEIRDSASVNTMRILEKKVKDIKDNLFKGVSSGFLQKQYFEQHFGLVVSSQLQ